MTSATETLEDLLRETLDRLDRQERRTASLEAVLLHSAPPTGHTADTPTVGHETPLPLPRPPKRPGGPFRPATADGRDAPGRPTRSRGAVPAEVLASLEDVIWSISPDGELVFSLAGGVERTFGRAANEFIERPGLWLEVVPDDDRTALRTALRHLPATDGFTLEHRVETPAGSVRWVVTRGRLVRGPDGHPVRVDGITTDTTARARTERAGLTALEAIGPATGADFVARVVEQLATVFDARAAVVAVPAPADLAEARTAAVWIDGRPADGFTFSAAGGFVRPALAGASQSVPSAARDRFPADEFLGRLRAEAAAAEPLVDAAGELLGFVAVVDDRAARPGGPDVRAVLRAIAPRIVSELTRPADATARVRDLETQLAAAEGRADRAEARVREEAGRPPEQARQASRLEVVGRLVAGVAHDFNNLLTVISGNAQLVRDLLPPADPLREPTDLIAATADTAARVAGQLLTFTKPAASNPCAICPNATVRAVERMLRRLAGDRVELDLLLTPDVPPIRVDPAQFDQVLLNLVANARDAIPGTGVITVRTARAPVGPDRRGWPAACPAGEYVALTVTDTGCGMTEEVKARMFDPFFTTKGANGTGLGLATVRDIVRGAGGHVEVESAPEWGTSVRVFWAAAEGSIEAAPAPRKDPPPGGETVLLVQDGDKIRDVAAMALQHAGYRVLEAADGETGEDRARLYAGPIDLLVTDLGLPNRDGRELAGRVRVARPGVKVLYVSGYPKPDAGDGPFLAKPYTPNQLLEAVRRVLDSSP
ncbi:MAG: Blue-light-activated protein [Gemmataceae bacterium]|nr:Blue-light-activated protein [Gemmataceae bacterium]